MNFLEVSLKRNEYDRKKKNIPQDIHEFSICEIFAKYLSKEKKDDYGDVKKDPSLEEKGVDVIMSSVKGDFVMLQLVHSRDYDMNPKTISKEIDSSGFPIIVSAKEKCKKYFEKGIDTSNIILLIEGATIGSSVEDLVKAPEFLKEFQNLRCFKEIYYIHNFNDGYVYPLKR